MLNRNKYLRDWENRGFLAVLAILFFYYGYRMFVLTPWYDELYTYYYFISRGPVYAAIHWPLPNNHVGYSVLSGFLDLFGNAAAGLRGISFCSAIANVCLLYLIGKRHLKQYGSLTAVLIYISFNLVNQLAVQGRGYTLATSCYLLAFLMMDMICNGSICGKRHYIVFALSLTLGLYTLPSSIYWVLPLCMAGGVFLLTQCAGAKENRKKKGVLIRLIASAVSAAVMTVLLYTVIWLAIGSNLLSKEEGSGFVGQSHLQIILHAPWKAVKAGIDYMLATPYIQSETGGDFAGKLCQWFLTLFDYFHSGFAVIILAGIIIGIIGMIVGMFRTPEKEQLFLRWCIVIGIVSLPVILLLQNTLPYYRVFSFMGVLLSFLAAFYLQKIFIIRKVRWGNGLICGVIFMLAFLRLFSNEYNEQYGMREYYLEDALRHSDFADAGQPCVTDCTQQYMIKYLYGVECENREISGSDFLLLDRKMADADYDGFEWEFYHYYNTIPWDYIEDFMIEEYENEAFILYKLKPEK